MKKIKLTTEQQQLVTDNHNLIYHLMNKFNLSDNDVEDWYGICAIGLCNAALLFDSTKNFKFSTYACVCIEHEILKTFQVNNYPKRKCDGILSLDVAIPNTDGITYVNAIKDDMADSYVETIEFMECFERALNRLSDRNKEIILKLTSEKTRKELENEYEISKERIRQIVNVFNEKLKTELEKK